MRVNGLLLCGSLILLIGCSNLKKEATAKQQTPAPAPSTAVAATVPAPAKASATTASTSVAPQKESLTCKRGSEVRSLEIETLQPKGCKLWYSRYGNRNSVASSEKASTHCENVQARIQKNLETVQFTCTAGAISQDNSAPVVKTAAPPVTPVAKKELAPAAPQAASATAPAPNAPATAESQKK